MLMEFATRLGKTIHLDGVLLTILVASLGINVYLGLARNRPTPAATGPQLIPEGSQAPVFEGTSLTGNKVTLDYTRVKHSTLLYVFSPTCHWCEKNLANIEAVVRSRPDVRVIGVNIGPALQAGTVGKQPFSEILTPTQATVRAYRLGLTPSTVLISKTGKIMKAWSGAYAGPIADEVSKALIVSLPGLISQ